MQPLEQANKRAADLYWLAFLLTGHREPSLDVAIEALDFQDDGNPVLLNLDARLVATSVHRKSTGHDSQRTGCVRAPNGI